MSDSKDSKEEVKNVEEEPKQSHLMKIAEDRYLYNVDKLEETKQSLLNSVREFKMAPFYKILCKSAGWAEDEALYEELKTSNEAELKTLDEKIEDAEKNLGETEVRDAYVAKADFFARIGDKDQSLSAYEVAIKKTVGVGPKLDLMFCMLRVTLFWGDLELIRKQLEKTKQLVDEGGDWDRRNRLKVYQAVYLMMVRDFKEASKLLIDSIATFTATELFPYTTFVFHVVLVAMLTLDRPTLRDKVVKSPDILGTIREVPHLETFLLSLFNCKYSDFFGSLTTLTEQIKRDRFMGPHLRFLFRELRVVVYSQFLESYRSVTLASMARAFDITPELLDRDLAQFIYAGRLNCKIDKVGGIVETNRPDARNAQYQSVIKHGDNLLNRIQKLSRVITY
eukprot:TRINITY_DN38_c0_g1_i1.p1 TRINITY_DN38_c0_g1~~TRINITY_DN38_c0_g1_i1.p1  ORF type:complete len:394 (+),score=96.35 TRINITY_DN38_c0_g1_i1:79-1260(+)